MEVAVIVLDKEAKKVRQKFIFDKKMIHEELKDLKLSEDKIYFYKIAVSSYSRKIFILFPN